MSETATRQTAHCATLDVPGFVRPVPEPLDPRDLCLLVQDRLQVLLPLPADADDLVGRAMHDFTLAGGKRLRPVLMLMAARGMGHSGPGIVDAACAVEMVHGASLILDDLPCMDDAALRRGVPTLHRQHGEDVAILASIALLGRAFQVVAEAEGIAPGPRAELVALLGAAIGNQGLVGGQLKDLRATRGARPEQEVVRTNELKTGALFGAALEMAGVLAGADRSRRSLLRRFAIELGHAFQLLDDLRDGMASAVSGKDAGKDVDKCTLVDVLGREGAQARMQGHLATAQGILVRTHGPHSRLGVFVHQLFGSV